MSEVTAPTLSPWHVAILVPARNEEALLPECIRSIAQARASLPINVTSDVVIMSDGSTDATVALAREALGQHGTVLEADAGCVGVARSLATACALRRYTGDVRRCWLVNTDADCSVPRDWLLDHLRHAQQGWSAVAGIVDVSDFSEHDTQVKELFRASYRIHADGTHPHVHGANIGMRADAYLMAGGWSPLFTAEDHDLWSRLRSSGLPCLSDARLVVETSGRRIGRAPNGFAQALAAHNDKAAA